MMSLSTEDLQRLSELLSAAAQGQTVSSANRAGSESGPVLEVAALAPAKARSLDEDFGIASFFFDELPGLKRRLSLISEGLADIFVRELLESRAYASSHQIASDLEKSYLDRALFQDPKLLAYARRLVAQGAASRLHALVRCADILGSAQRADEMIAYVEETVPLVVVPWQPAKPELRSRAIQGKPIPAVTSTEDKPQTHLETLRTSLVGSLYLKYFKRIPFVRDTALRLWRFGYPLYVNRISRFISKPGASGPIPLRSLREVTEELHLSPEVLCSAEIVTVKPPRVLSPNPDEKVDVGVSQYRFPDIYVASLPEVMVMGGSNIVLRSDCAIHHDLYNFGADYTSEELHQRLKIDPVKRRLQSLLVDRDPVRLQKVATFVDACAPNYAHWLTEVLPRISLFCQHPDFLGVPIVINDGLHRNILDSISLCVGEGREVVYLPTGRVLAAQELLLTSVVGYIPFDRRAKGTRNNSHGMFSPSALSALRSQLAGVAGSDGADQWPDKLFLRRNSGARTLSNSSDLEAIAVNQGFVVVEPEKLSFMRQIQLFSNAKVVVGATGAALANSIFCQPGTRIAVMISSHKEMPYGYWASMLQPIGVDLTYILGDIVNNHQAGVHGDFQVKPELFAAFVSAMN